MQFHLPSKRITAATLVSAAAIAGLLATNSAAAPAAAPAPVAANHTTVTPVRVEDTRTDGKTLGPGGVLVLHLAGTHGIPAAATAVTLNVTSVGSTLGGVFTVYPDGAARPTASNVNFTKGQTIANLVTVALGTDGSVDFWNEAGTANIVADLQGYDTAVPPVCQATTNTITPKAVALTHVGGSIRTGITDAGSVHLNPGVFDVRVLGNFTGLNSTDDTPFTGHQLYGTMVIWTGDAIAPDFSNTITDGGHLIDQADSTTLTVDPTTQASTFLTVPAGGEDLHVGFFAYLDNSQGFTGADAANVKATIQSAQFRSTC